MAAEVERHIRNFQKNFNSHVEPDVQKHLKNVYATLTMCVLSAAIGAYIEMTSEMFGTMVPLMFSLGCLLGFTFTRDDQGKNMGTRLLMLLGFTFSTGLGLAPLLRSVVSVNPGLILTALLGTTVIFAAFSLCSMLSSRGQWLFLGGPLMAYMSSMILISLIFGFRAFGAYEVYIGLGVMCAFVLFDTQVIIERRRMGDKDFLKHSLDLFIDFVNIFRRLLIILAKKEDTKKNQKR